MTPFTREGLQSLFALDRPSVKFRHDVDYDPACALEMARAEQAAHIRATYFVMARGTHYNPFSRTTTEVLHGIIAAGHQLAVHVDLGLPRDADTPGWLLSRAATADHRLLSQEFPVTREVSYHAPPRSVYWQHVPGFEHALQPTWEGRLVSDSRGVWHGDPVELLKRTDPVQLLTHAEWWFWPQEKADEWRALEAAKP